ncbi:hypothetical protein [Methylotenera sp. L2L1]|uniref:hypothetical protein n=1 Tax=Methylotenera sp. L2L1 TaxID=1502770 RepID=UPI000560002C|nr:hypothetical protein [Methylotenera sp. L2L1]
MNLRNISTREQILIFVVALVFIGGGYGLLRYRPALAELAKLQASNLETAERTKKAVIPDEPNDNPEELEADIAYADKTLETMNARFIQLEQRLAPEESQELRLSISNLANNVGVRIRENIPYVIPSAAGVKSQATPKANLTRRAQKAARKAAGGRLGGVGADAVMGTAPLPGELSYRLVNDLDSPRPFQRVSLEGNFYQLQRFIDELGKLPSMVTVTQMQVELSAQTPPAGYPQPLLVTMILVL